MKTLPQAPSGYAIRAVDLHDADDALVDRVVAFAQLMDHEAVPVPSTLKPTPSVVPDGVAAEPRFKTRAEKTACEPLYRVAGLQETEVTTTSGKPFVGRALTWAE